MPHDVNNVLLVDEDGEKKCINRPVTSKAECNSDIYLTFKINVQNHLMM